MMRRDQLCPGPTECIDVLNVNPRPKPDSPRCEECPVTTLDAYLGSAAGQQLLQTVDLDFALQAGVNITLGDISYPEFLLLRLLAEERNRYQEERMKAVQSGRK